MGINFFLNNSVAFDLQNQQTLYTSNVVPEPSIPALLILSCCVLVLGLRCARHPGQRL
ncbi:MAG: PEP-CTERM sorting domain-containing protein [Verrucomicrobiaceae bacterium]|nr:MAG: PEP-CTERM sorting domain-containing protein [Verrucomicrobiaceae bacterium]